MPIETMSPLNVVLQRLAARIALLSLLVIVTAAQLSAAAADSSSSFFRIGDTTIADIGYYYSLLTAQDSGIFAASCGIVGPSDMDYSPFNIATGVRTRYAIPSASTAFDTSNLTNTIDTAYRANVLSDLFVTMSVMYLESAGLMPFTRTDAISSTYLPSSYSGSTVLVNAAFPDVSITLNMLLMHTSSIIDTNFNLGAAEAPSGTATTLAGFVSSLFSTAGTSIFNATAMPGRNTSYSYARTNTALVSFIVERVLAASTTYSTLSGIGEFVFGVLLPPLGLTNTFLLNSQGQYIQTTYPFSSTNTQDMRLYKAVQDLSADGTAVQTTYPIHAAYFSDYMLYTTSSDLTEIARAVFLPNGFYYSAIGSRMLATSITVGSSDARFAVGRTPGLFLFSPNLLCAILYTAVGEKGDLPYCYFDGSSIPLGATPFGMVSTGGTSQVALVCIPLVNSRTLCSIAELSFNTTTWPSGNAATAGDRAVGLAMVNLARFASDNQPTTTTTTPAPAPSTRLNGWFIFVGVVASLVVVVVAAFAADYFIQPPPPAKIIAPVLTGASTGIRAGTSLTEGARANNHSAVSAANAAAAANIAGYDEGDDDEPLGGNSPKHYRDAGTVSSSLSDPQQQQHGQHGRHGRSRYAAAQHNGRHRTRDRDSGDEDGSNDDDVAEDEEYGGANDTTPYILRSINQQAGGSSLRRRRNGQRQQPHVQPGHGPRRLSHYESSHNRNDLVSSDADSYTSHDDDDWEEEEAERSSTGSQRPNPQGMLRFDAYI